LFALGEILFQAPLRAELLMCKAVADKTEPAVTYLAARLWLVGSTISLVAHQGESKANPGFQRLSVAVASTISFREVAWDLLSQPYLLSLARPGVLGLIRLALQPGSIGQPIVDPVAPLSSERTEEAGDNQNRGPNENYR
jgi:hypothetical protein